jgi:hypothetical protein
MRRKVLLMAVLVCSQPIYAQPPALPGGVPLFGAPDTPAPLQEDLLTFDPQQAQVRWVNGHWDLYAGSVLLKNFGQHESEAREAVRLIHSLRLTQYGSVGSPQPIMEYWLSDGHAPQAWGTSGLRLLPIDQASLRFEQLQGQWFVRDDRRLLFTFGSQRQEAERAVAILRRHGFTQIGYVGNPTPLMICMLGGQSGFTGSSSLLAPRSLSETIQPIKFTSAEQSGSVVPSAGIAASPLLQLQMAATSVRQLAPPRLDEADRIRFDPFRVVVRRDGAEWKLFAGNQPLANFGVNQQLAFQALGLMQSYHFTEQCLVGHSAPPFSYFLVNGQAPRGIKLGVRSEAFRPDTVTVRRVGTNWVVTDDSRTLLNFGEQAEDARQVAEAIKHYRFDHLCQFGYRDGESMRFFVRMR